MLASKQITLFALSKTYLVWQRRSLPMGKPMVSPLALAFRLAVTPSFQVNSIPWGENNLFSPKPLFLGF